MNKKILALLLSLVMLLCQSTLCFGEEAASAQEVASEDAELFADGDLFEGTADIEISGDMWSSFTVSNASYSVADGIGKFVADKNKRGNNEMISASGTLPLANYDEIVVKLKYTDVKTSTSRATKDATGYYVPMVRFEFECSTGSGTQKKTIEAPAVTGNENEVYSTADYLDVTLKISEIDGYEELTASKVNIYPIYGFKAGSVDFKSITAGFTEKEPEEEPEEPGNDTEYIWNFDTDTDGFVNQSSSVLTLTNTDGILKCENKAASGSGYMVNPSVNIDGAKVNRIEMRVKLENCGASNAGVTAAEFYWEGTDKSTGATVGIAQGRTQFVRYAGAVLSNGLYSTNDYIIVDNEFKPNQWENCIINKFRIDPVKNAAGTVYIDYVKLYYKEPSTEPDEPVIPDEPDNPADPGEPSVPGENIYRIDFTTQADVNMWKPNSKTQVAVSLVDDDYMKFVSTPTTNNEGKKQSGWATLPVEFDGNKYYKMRMRAKIEDYGRAFDNAAPFYTIYYAGKNASGGTQNAASSYAISPKWQCEENESGLFNSDWVEYEVDLGALNGWATMQSVSEFRIDFVKNAAGTVYVDYIEFVSLPEITSFTYDGIEGADMLKVPTTAKTLEVVIDETVNKIGAEDIAVYEKSDDDDKVYIPVSNVKYTPDTGLVAATLGEELLSNTDYVFEIKDTAMANSKQTLYRPLTCEFRTDASAFEIEITDLEDGTALVNFENQATARNIIIVATSWDGNKYVGKTLLPVMAEKGETKELIEFDSLGGSSVEIAIWELVKGKPVVIGKKVEKITK